jgi:hypothetical protein
MKRALIPLLAALALLAACGSDDAAPSEDDSDKRAAAMACLEEAGIEARLEGEEEIVIGDGADAPRIQFFLTAGESEAAQFEGDGEGAEQIGSALLYVGSGSDALLEDVENCLADL